MKRDIVMKLATLNPAKKLVLSMLFDFIGMMTFIDLLWAPLSGYIMTKMYPGKVGNTAGVITFLEEIIPGFDIIPSFTIMWLYIHLFSSNRKSLKVN